MNFGNTKAKSKSGTVSVLAKLCLLLFLSTFFAAQTAYGFLPELQEEQEDTLVVFSDDFLDFSNNPFHRPFTPKPNSPETPDENTCKEGSDDELNEWHFISVSAENLKSGLAKSSALSFLLSYQKRPPISLFILLCSWSGFLA